MIRDTGTAIEVYPIYAAVSLFELWVMRNCTLSISVGERRLSVILSVLFSIITISTANSESVPKISLMLELIGGYFVFKWMLHFGYRVISSQNAEITQKAKNLNAPRFTMVFFISVTVLWLLFYFSYAYPGFLSNDSISQLTQIERGVYSDHHPYWHTMMIRIFYEIGKKIFGTMEGGLSVFFVFQILVMAACFGYAIFTIIEIGANRITIISSSLCLAIMPYNIYYSVTMWKDVAFGISALLWVTSFYRILRRIGNYLFADYVFFLAGTFGVALFRQNGYYALVAVLLLSLILLKKRSVWVALIMIAALATSYVMKHQVLEWKNVEPTEFVESLSIPIQQVSRVLADKGQISEEQIEMIDRVIDHNIIPEVYHSHISDYVKGTIDTEYLEHHKQEYLKMWVDIGIKNPKLYVRAWVDQTKGYWNAGYKYWVWREEVAENSLGLEYHVRKNPIAAVFRRYIVLFGNGYPQDICLCLGAHVWIVVLLFCYNFIHKNTVETIMCALNVFVVMTLLIATPVFCEFRYAYCVFTTLPLIVPCTISRGMNEHKAV